MGHSHHDAVNPLLVGVLGVISGAILVAFIHCMLVNCRRTAPQTITSPPNRPPRMYHPPRLRVERDSTASLSFPATTTTSATASTSTSGSSVLLPVHKYSKDFKEGMCAVCLGEFEENDDVKIMPECAHVFHVSCIDMWLFSHGNCPLCRANTTPRTHDVLLSIVLNSRTID